MSDGIELGSALRDECTPWPKARNNYGYGLVSRGGKTQLAHRFYYQVAYGPINNRQVVRHKCDNPPCVNVLHLEIGTHKQNMRDRGYRGRTRNQWMKKANGKPWKN